MGWVARCPGGLDGGEVMINGLDRTRTDVLVRRALAPGRSVGADHAADSAGALFHDGLRTQAAWAWSAS